MFRTFPSFFRGKEIGGKPSCKAGLSPLYFSLEIQNMFGCACRDAAGFRVRKKVTSG